MLSPLVQPKEIEDNPDSITGQYLSGIRKIPIPERRRTPTSRALEVKGVGKII